VKPETLLYRQIHPSFVQNGRPTSQAFRPASKDEKKLSVYDGDKIQPKASWEHYTQTLRLSSHGVLGFTYEECTGQSLSVLEDGADYPEHCSVDFSSLAKNAIGRVAKVLAQCAMTRGWLYRDIL
jgi:hypothetical protein